MKHQVLLSCMISVLLFAGCMQHARQAEVLLWEDEIPEQYACRDRLKADSLFQYACPIMPEGKEFIYLFDAGCSFCIAKALDCYSSFLQAGQKASFYFLSRKEDNDIFVYSFMQKFHLSPKVYSLPSQELSFPDGLFLVNGNRVEAYVSWN